MGHGSVVNQIVEQALLSTHTGFFAEVLSVKGFTAKIQPLHLYKPRGKQERKHDPVSEVPIMHNVRKWRKRTIKFTDEDTTDGDTTQNGTVVSAKDKSHNHKFDVYEPVMIEKGDIVYCVCADRDITDTKKGKFALPSLGHHSLSNAVVVGVVESKEFISKEKTTLKKE